MRVTRKDVLGDIIEKRKHLTFLLIKKRSEGDRHHFDRSKRRNKKSIKNKNDKKTQPDDDNASIIEEKEVKQFETLETKVKMAMCLRRNGFFSIRKLQNKLSTSFLENIELIKSEKLCPPLSPLLKSPSPVCDKRYNKNHRNTSELNDIVRDLKPFDLTTKYSPDNKKNSIYSIPFEMRNKNGAGDL